MKTQGHAAEASAQVQASKAQLDQINSTFQQQLMAQNVTVNQERAIVATLLTQVTKAAGQAQAAVTAGAAATAQVAAVPDTDIQKDLEGKLGALSRRPRFCGSMIR